MHYTYIIYSLLFLVSFAFARQTLLNENVYVKQFAFGIVFIILLAGSMISSFKQRQVKIKVLSITPGDLLVTGLLIVYACFYWGTSNNLDFTRDWKC